MADSFLPYGRQVIEDDDIAAVAQVLRGDWLTTGPTVDAFETAFAAKVGAAHAIACTSGTAGLHLAALAFRMGFGDAVVVPAVTFLATANAVRYVGGEVVFSDVDPDTGLMRLADLERAIASAEPGLVRAVFPVHLAGHTADVPTMRQAYPRLAFVEDACHALGASYNSQRGMVPVGSCPMSEVAVFSTHPVKTMTTGEGGVLTTNHPVLAQRLKMLRNHGMVRDPAAFRHRGLAFEGGGETAAPWYYEMHELGFNYRLTDIQCALGMAQLAKLDRFVERRRALRNRYVTRLAEMGPHVRMAPVAPGCEPSWHLAVALIEFNEIGMTRTRVVEELRDRGVGTQVHYVPVHLQPYYRQRYGALQLPGAERYYARCLSLPLYPSMKWADVDRVCDQLAEVLGLG